ncbi:hypothetical protein V0288_08640 [Pannus brasiliensis CCIBt3594]|uniref:Avidin family protein n=1 Tax=Pannus brasiliensis CCIBt3594 TaxID=1427578 RepID=A0AAW9QW34_9CHRO
MSNLSGTWLGTYWQEGQPTRFEMTLVQGENTLSGNILDDGYLGEATLAGEVIGRRISFTKTYLGGIGHSVAYTGIVAEDEDSMSGDWQIKNLVTGTWEAHRSKDDLTAELMSRLTAKVPAGVR